jgi:Zn-dependent metalloprotease
MSRFFTKLFLLMIFSVGLSAQNREIVQQFLDNKKVELELSSSDISNWVIYDEYRSENIGVTHVYIRQAHAGIEVYNAVANFNIKDAAVFSMGNRLETNISKRINSTKPKLTPEDAILKAATQLNLVTNEVVLVETKNDKQFIFTASTLSLENIPVKLMFQPMPEGEIRLVWDMSIYQTDKQHWWSLRVDAISGEILDKVDWVLKCDFGSCGHQWHGTTKRPIPSTADLLPAPPPNTDQYRVFAIPVESPSHGPRSLVVGPYNTTASPFGWHDLDGEIGHETTNTSGNNVDAYDDIANLDAPGQFADADENLQFNFNYTNVV